MDHRDADVSLTDHGLRWKHGKQAATGVSTRAISLMAGENCLIVFGYDYIKGRIREGQSIVTDLSDRVAEESFGPVIGTLSLRRPLVLKEVRSKDLHASLSPRKDDLAEAAPKIETRQRLRLTFQPLQQESVIHCAYLDC